jgi:hypothetical protein
VCRLPKLHPSGHLGDREPVEIVITYSAELPQNLGRTGVACMDSFVEELESVGYLYNYSRMWIAALPCSLARGLLASSESSVFRVSRRSLNLDVPVTIRRGGPVWEVRRFMQEVYCSEVATMATPILISEDRLRLSMRRSSHRRHL